MLYGMDFCLAYFYGCAPLSGNNAVDICTQDRLFFHVNALELIAMVNRSRVESQLHSFAGMKAYAFHTDSILDRMLLLHKRYSQLKFSAKIGFSGIELLKTALLVCLGRFQRL